MLHMVDNPFVDFRTTGNVLTKVSLRRVNIDRYMIDNIRLHDYLLKQNKILLLKRDSLILLSKGFTKIPTIITFKVSQNDRCVGMF